MVWLAAGAAAFIAVAFLAHKYATSWLRSEASGIKAPSKSNDTSSGVTDNPDASKLRKRLPTPDKKVVSSISIPTTTVPILNASPSEHAETSPTTPKAKPSGLSLPKKAPQINGHVPVPPPTKGSITPSPPRLTPPTFGSMPPPPRPSNLSAPLRPPPSAASSLRAPPPPRPTAPPQPKTLGPPPSSSLTAPSASTTTTKNPSRKVLLSPGHSPLDWAALTRSPNSSALLRGPNLPPTPTLVRVLPSHLAKMNGRKGRPAWTSYQGRVYNVTAYLPFHPGGQGELLRAAGRDGAKLFAEVHPWVNWEGILGECWVGVLGQEGEEEVTNRLDEMD